MRNEVIARMSHDERMARNLEKRRKIMGFLRKEIWTTQPIIARLLHADGMVATQDVVCRLLKSLEKEGLITRETILNKNVIGITMTGQAAAAEALGKEFLPKAYEKGRVSFSTIPHREALHLAYILLAKQGWREWRFPDRQAAQEKASGRYRPDAIAQAPDGARVALEIELTIKTKKRYMDVVCGHLQNISAGDYSRVIYLTALASHRTSLESLFSSIDRVVVNGQEKAFNDEEKKLFSFITLDSLKDQK